jgi:hypothetical protein
MKLNFFVVFEILESQMKLMVDFEQRFNFYNLMEAAYGRQWVNKHRNFERHRCTVGKNFTLVKIFLQIPKPKNTHFLREKIGINVVYHLYKKT